MNTKRLIVFLLALAAGGSAAALVLSAQPPAAKPSAPPPVQGATPVVVVPPAPTVLKADVLVAAVAIATGERIRAEQLKWQSWPADLLPAQAIVRSTSPNAVEALKGSAARVDIAAGEPMSARKALKLGDSGYLATILSPGMRAAAVPLDPKGARSAGGFIAPSDRVDVLVTQLDPKNPTRPISRTVLENVRVLAIGQQIGDASVQGTAVSPNGPQPPGSSSIAPQGTGQRLFMADNATLEVSPGQALDLAAAAKGGELTLVLRASSDGTEREASGAGRERRTLTTVRFGTVRVMGQ